MGSVKPPPIYNPVVDIGNDGGTNGNGKDSGSSGIATQPWILFFSQLFDGDSGTAWLPLFTNLTEVGGAPSITGIYYQLTRRIAYFRIDIVPQGGSNTSSTAGSTLVNNFPLKMIGNGICFAVSGLLGSNSGACDQTSNNIYVPSWSAVTVPLSIIGIVEAS